jgi:hypothetical protein
MVLPPDADVAVTVTVYLPAGLPVSVDPFDDELPPPHPRTDVALRIATPIISKCLKHFCRLPLEKGRMSRKASAVIVLALVTGNRSRRAALGAVVLMVRIVVPAWPGVAVRLAGVKLQVLSAGRPEHAKVTEPERPPFAVTVSCAFTVCPRVTLREAGLELMEKSGAGAVVTVMVLEVVLG